MTWHSWCIPQQLDGRSYSCRVLALGLRNVSACPRLPDIHMLAGVMQDMQDGGLTLFEAGSDEPGKLVRVEQNMLVRFRGSTLHRWAQIAHGRMLLLDMTCCVARCTA